MLSPMTSLESVNCPDERTLCIRPCERHMAAPVTARRTDDAGSHIPQHTAHDARMARAHTTRSAQRHSQALGAVARHERRRTCRDASGTGAAPEAGLSAPPTVLKHGLFVLAKNGEDREFIWQYIHQQNGQWRVRGRKKRVWTLDNESR